MSEPQDQAKGRLFLYGPLEPRDDTDEVGFTSVSIHRGCLWLLVRFNWISHLLHFCSVQRLERCHRDMSKSVTHLREVEIYNHLNDKVMDNSTSW